MKLFANGFNLYGQLMKRESLVENFSVIFESEVIPYFGLNLSFSYFVKDNSLLIYKNKIKKVIPLDISKISTFKHNDDRIIILYEDGNLMRVDLKDMTLKPSQNALPMELKGEKIINAASGSKLTVFQSEKGKLFSMANPMKFDASKIIQLECGREHCLLLDITGNVYSFGRGSRGQLGHGNLEDEEEPILIEALAGIGIRKIAVGGWHSCALSAEGDLYTWGWNGNGQLGLSKNLWKNTVSVQATPQPVDYLSTEVNITDIVCGNRHTLALLENHQLYGCGWNKYKQLKNELTEDYHTFTHMWDFAEEDVIRINAGPWNSAVLCK